MYLKLTDFALRKFDGKFKGTKILDHTPEEFEKRINDELGSFSNIDDVKILNQCGCFDGYVHDGYAPFCKLIAIKNFTNARIGSMEITLENYQYLRSGYVKRREDELPMFSRWFELPIKPPVADWLILILYSKDQINKELLIESEKRPEVEFDEFDADWGIIDILGQTHPNEEPLKPETMIRNSFLYGGSDVPFNEEEYLKSVEFWNKYAIIK